jgi:hypothetical protein
MGNIYSIPSRLIGTVVLVRVRPETLEGYVGTVRALTLPRLSGKQQHHINYTATSSGPWCASPVPSPPTCAGYLPYLLAKKRG